MLISKYTDDWRLIAELTASWPYTQEEVYKELEPGKIVGKGQWVGRSEAETEVKASYPRIRGY